LKLRVSSHSRRRPGQHLLERVGRSIAHHGGRQGLSVGQSYAGHAAVFQKDLLGTYCKRSFRHFSRWLCEASLRFGTLLDVKDRAAVPPWHCIVKCRKLEEAAVVAPQEESTLWSSGFFTCSLRNPQGSCFGCSTLAVLNGKKGLMNCPFSRGVFPPPGKAHHLSHIRPDAFFFRWEVLAQERDKASWSCWGTLMSSPEP